MKRHNDLKLSKMEKIQARHPEIAEKFPTPFCPIPSLCRHRTGFYMLLPTSFLQLRPLMTQQTLDNLRSRDYFATGLENL